MKSLKWSIPLLSVCSITFLVINFLPFKKPVLDHSITHPIQISKKWDTVYPVILTENLLKMWKKVRNDKKYSQPRWAKVSIKEATEIIVELCNAYNIKYPDKVIKNKEYLKRYDDKNNKFGLPIVAGQTNINRSTGEIIIYFRNDNIFLMNVFHEFYHLLDYRKNGNWKMSVGKDKICDFSGNIFWFKYVSEFFKYEKMMSQSNRF